MASFRDLLSFLWLDKSSIAPEVTTEKAIVHFFSRARNSSFISRPKRSSFISRKIK